MRKLAKLLPLVILIVSTLCAKAQTIENQDALSAPKEMPKGPSAADEVKAAYLHAWMGYKEYAWGMDALKPLSKTGHNWYDKSLLMTPVDAYDGLVIMGFKEEAAAAKALILKNLKFDEDMEVQNFEVSIRILGGLLSAYQLDGDKKFLALAKDLADRLIKCFDSPTGMPYRYVNLKTGKTREAISNPAEIGTYVLEYGILSRELKDKHYYEVAKKAMMALYAKHSALNLPGSSINVETGDWVSTASHISGGIDSYFEYMLKAGILFDDADFKDMWKNSLGAINKYLLDTRYSSAWYGRADMNDGIIKSTGYGSLDAFFAGSLAMGGNVSKGVMLQESNYKMWTLFGIEPEGLDYSTMEITSPSYELRPENIESAYYLYQYTHDSKYRDMGQEMFNSLIKYCKNDVGFCALADVRTGEKKDEMESFFLAETLKYAFLLLDNTNALAFDKVIFNTEAHPFLRSQKK